MPSLIFAPVSTTPLLPPARTHADAPLLLGVCPLGGGDDHIHVAHRPSTLYMEAQTLYLHL